MIIIIGKVPVLGYSTYRQNHNTWEQFQPVPFRGIRKALAIVAHVSPRVFTSSANSCGIGMIVCDEIAHHSSISQHEQIVTGSLSPVSSIAYARGICLAVAYDLCHGYIVEIVNPLEFTHRSFEPAPWHPSWRLDQG